MTGYYSGVLEGQTKLQQMADEEASRQSTIQKTNIEKANFDDKQKQADIEAKIAGKVFSSTSGDRLSGQAQDGVDSLGNSYADMAKQLAGTNPELANKYFKLAMENKAKSSAMQKDALAIQAHKLTNSANLAATVVDQASLDAAIPQLADLGVAVPPQFQTFGPETSEWFKSKAMQSVQYRATLKLQDDKQKVAFTQQEKQLADERANKRIAQKDSQIALEREKIDRGSIKTPAYQKTTEKQLDNSVSYLSEKYPNFADADEETQKQAAQDVIPKTVEYMKTLGLPQDQAKKMALEHIAKSIDNEGVYNPTPVVSTKAPINKPIVGGETRMINGSNYTKVPGGWKKIN